MKIHISLKDKNIEKKLSVLRKNVGFVTIATGIEKYHIMAYTLLKSYKNSTKNPLRFCVITDCESKYTDSFDDVIILDDSTRSYVDKIKLLKIAPYKETIFIDADCIAFNDLNVYFEIFNNGQDFNVFGRKLPLDDDDGWFSFEHLGIFKDKVKSNLDIHGGIYYIRPGDICNTMYSYCDEIINNYESFKFKKFKKPADEPIIALAMALVNYVPTKSKPDYYSWYRRTKHINADFFDNKLNYYFDKCYTYNGKILHFGTIHTICFIYLLESKKVLYFDIYKKRWGFFTMIWNSLFCFVKSFCLYFIFLFKRVKKMFRL